MTLEARLERAAAAAGARAGGDRVAAVMPARPGADGVVYLVAYQRDGDLSYLALDERLEPITDRRLVRDAVTMLALAEHAEEASGATSAELLEQRFGEALAALRSAGLAAESAATSAVLTALRALAEAAAGPRVATPAYLDGLAAAAADVAVALEMYQEQAEQLARRVTGTEGDPLEPAARAALAALAAAAAAADPRGVALTLAGATGAVEALADDVAERYRLPLV
jgi:hypothetical protein